MNSLTRLQPHLGRSGLVLAYHDILPDTGTVYPYAVRESTFLHQLDVVSALGLRPVSLADFTDELFAGDASGYVAIVFDDALVGVHRTAMPRLSERGIPWTMLPVTDRTGLKPSWWKMADRTMTRVEIAEALDGGATLCGHTATHVSLPDLPRARALEELRRSRDALSSWSGQEVRELCYPFGHQDSEVRKLAAEAGYRCGYTFTNGRCHPADDPYLLPRLAMHDGLRSSRLIATLIRPRLSWPPVRDRRAHTQEETA